MHIFAYMLSKPPLFPPYHFPLLFFPFLHSLTCPYLLCLSSGQRPPSTKTKKRQRKRSRRGSNKGAWAGRGGQNRLIWDDMSHTGAIVQRFCSRGPCDQPHERVALFHSCSSFHPLPSSFLAPLSFCISRQEISTHRGADGSGGTQLDFPRQAVCFNEQRPASGCLRMLAKYKTRHSQTPVKNREVWRKGKRCAHIWATWWNRETLPETLAKQKYREMMCNHEPLQLFNPGVYTGWALRRWPSHWPHCCVCAAKIPH